MSCELPVGWFNIFNDNNHKNSLITTVLGNKEKFIFIEIAVIFSFFTDGKLQPTERKHYLGESELYGCLRDLYFIFKPDLPWEVTGSGHTWAQGTRRSCFFSLRLETTFSCVGDVINCFRASCCNRFSKMEEDQDSLEMIIIWYHYLNVLVTKRRKRAKRQFRKYWISLISV